MVLENKDFGLLIMYFIGLLCSCNLILRSIITKVIHTSEILLMCVTYNICQLPLNPHITEVSPYLDRLVRNPIEQSSVNNYHDKYLHDSTEMQNYC